MGRAPDPRNVALADQALTALRERGLPMTTAEISTAIGVPTYLQDAWRVLNRLANRGEVVRISLPGYTHRYWRLPEPATVVPGRP